MNTAEFLLFQANSTHFRDRCAEFGLISETMHKVDEQATVSDIERLTTIYARILESYFETTGASRQNHAS